MNSNTSYLCRRQSAIIKGILTLLIVLGHDIVFTMPTDVVGIMSFLYLFHIQCFFILPFLYGVNSEKSIFEKSFTLVKRFYWPYSLLLLLLGTIYGILSSHTLIFSFIGIGKAMLFGGIHVKSACGVSILWFLPSMMCTMFLREIYYLAGRMTKAILLTMSILYNVIIVFNAIESSMLQLVNVFKWLPFGSNYAIGVLYMGVITRWVYIKVVHTDKKKVLLFCGLILLSISLGYFGLVVPNTINYAAHPLYIIISRFSSIVFFIILCVCCGHMHNNHVYDLLMKIGNKSLYIYLISPFVGYILAFICIRLNIVTWYVGLLVFPVILMVSYYFAGFIRGKFERFCFPR